MNPTLETIHSLRSTHGSFGDRPVSDEAVETILAASVRAANAGNGQNYAVIVVRDPAVMKEVCGYSTSVMLIWCLDVHRNKALAKHLDLAYPPIPPGRS